MARKILCLSCNIKTKQAAEKFNEFYESIYGNAFNEMLCDDCGTIISPNEQCVASVLLDSKEHPNYKHQNPKVWAWEKIIIQDQNNG